jgi:hypothetical protein
MSFPVKTASTESSFKAEYSEMLGSFSFRKAEKAIF